MYARLDNGWIKPEFIIEVEQFVEFAKMHPELCVDLINEIDDFGFKKVTELGGEEINHRIQKSCGCDWKK